MGEGVATIPPSQAVMVAMEALAYDAYARLHDARALDLATRAHRVAPERPYPCYLLGELAMRQRAWRDALMWMGRAIQLGRHDAMTHLRAGQAAFHAGDDVRAALFLQQAWSAQDLPAPARAQTKQLIMALQTRAAQAM